MNFILRLLTWWHGQTIGTQIHTWLRGVRVGEDEEGNVYYRSKDGKRRWVCYNGEPEASRIPPDWHGWLHYTWDEPPSERPLARKPWEKPHVPNPTGTLRAYAPAGSILRGRPKEWRDYEPWRPE